MTAPPLLSSSPAPRKGPGVAQSADVAIVGAGPAGLFQAFQLALLGLRPLLLDALPHAGGQCIELYPDKPIYDLPGLPVCTGRELVERLLTQLAPLKVPLHLGSLVSTLQVRPDGSFLLANEAGLAVEAGSVVLATGVGAFVPRKPAGLAGLAEAEAAGRVVYHPEARIAELADRRLIVIGDEEPALQWALRLSPGHPDTVLDPTGRPVKARRVALMHRRDRWRASDATLEALQALRAAGGIDVLIGQPFACVEPAAGPFQLQWQDAEGREHLEATDHLLPLLGLSPKLGPLQQWGLALERKQVPVRPEDCQTATPGLFAIGDINHYPGKRKLILCGFHEATMCAYAIAQRAQGDTPLQVLYTTTSAVLQARLGVEVDGTPPTPP